MKALDQRIAIAEACGWTDYQPPTRQSYEDHLEGTTHPWTMLDPSGKWHRIPPDYLNSFDAMYDAIGTKWSNPRFRVIYSAVLSGLFNHNYIEVIRAKPADMARAFLVSLNLWTEST